MATGSGQTYTINGVRLQFPCKAYPSQISMMDKIIKGLERSQNCLLESPTGSGKSLALLCSALAWQAAERDKCRQEEEKQKDAVNECCCHMSTVEVSDTGAINCPPPAVPYDVDGTSAMEEDSASVNGTLLYNNNNNEGDDDDDDFKVDRKKNRSIVGQVVPTSTMDSPAPAVWPIELKPSDDADNTCCCKCNDASAYVKRKVPKIYFGTRTHKQIAQIVRELNKTAYNNVRMTILSSRENTCVHPYVSSHSNKNEACRDLMDGSGCPYFDRARRIFSHNFLESHRFAKIWDLEDIVPFGSHNKACAYYGVRQLRETADIIFCPYNYLIDPSIRHTLEISLANQIVILDEAHNIEDSSRESASFSVSQTELLEAMQNLDYVAGFGVKPTEHQALRAMCADLGQLIEQNKNSMPQSTGYDMASKVWSGIEIVAQLELLGLGAARFSQLQACYSAVKKDEEETTDSNRRGRQDPKKESEMKIKAATSAVLGGIFMVLGFIYQDAMKFVDDYRVVIVKAMSFSSLPSENRWLSKRRKNQQLSFTFQLNFWCMNPSVAFSDMSRGVRSVILTSGTLSPMTSFQSELGIPFPIQLEANHVIGNSQVWVGCISRGPNNKELLGSYQNTETFAYQDEIGQILHEICQTVPYGVLCFLPSYKALEKYCSRWQDTGLMSKITLCKVVITEPRASDRENFDDIMKRFYDIIKECTAKDIQGLSSVTGITGALFLAVCRGKVSEGMDFTDNNARAVITVGIPYPNIKDTQVELKKQYNDRRSSKGLLCGRDWYEIQAYRAMNQALGRCIRHRKDWGALILIDERFAKCPQKYVSGLSKWVRNRVQYFNVFQNARQSLRQFTVDRCCESAADADEASFLSTPLDTSTSSVATTPLKAIQNITDLRNPSIAENSVNCITAAPAVDAVNDLSDFCHPELTSTPAASQSRQRSRGRVSRRKGYVDPDQTTLMFAPIGPFSSRVVTTGFSQCGGFLPESQPVDITQMPATISRPADANVVDLTLDDSPCKGKISAIDFRPKFASTQIGSSYGPNAVAVTSLDGVEASQIDAAEEEITAVTGGDSKSSAAPTDNDVCLEMNCLSEVPISNSVGGAKLGFTRPVIQDSRYRSESPELFDEDQMEFEYSIVAASADPNAANENACDGQQLSNKRLYSDTFKEPTNVVSLANGNTSLAQKLVNRKLASEKQKPTFVPPPMGLPTLNHVNSSESEKPKPKVIVPLMELKLQLPNKLFGNSASNHTAADAEADCSMTSSASVSTTWNRRSVLQRCRGPNVQQQKKRGVDFLDELDEVSTCDQSKPKLVCPTCSNPLLNISINANGAFVRETYQPGFWKLLTGSKFKHGSLPFAALTISNKHIQSKAFTLQTAVAASELPAGVVLNSYWSSEDGCCVQPVYCLPCHDTDSSSTWLGVEVKAALVACSSRVKVGQVWLVPQCLNE